VIPYTLGGYIASTEQEQIDIDHPEFQKAEEDSASRIESLLSIKGSRTVDDFHRELGLTVWDYCGMSRSASGLDKAREKVRSIRSEFWENVSVSGTPGEFNQVLERAGRVADFMEFAELMMCDARTREESCGGHFREEHQTSEGEALRDDENFAFVSAWGFNGVGNEPTLNKEQLTFENVQLTQRSYK